ncbi:MAG: response regulator [Phycisphaerae bacterium]|jgi:PAS domain S-box-containing protein|nr:response regulator [Phycisphaerae bacterium]
MDLKDITTTTPLRLLLVGDSENDALLVLRTLDGGGYKVEFQRVETAAEMSVALANETWDLVISDFRMLQFDGLCALAVLQESGIDTPFILVSEAIGEDVAVTAMKGGAHDYVIKGNLKRLPSAVERELREAEVRRDRKLARKALAKSERLNRRLLESSPIGVLYLDREGVVNYTNRSYNTIMGYEGEVNPMLGKKLADMPSVRKQGHDKTIRRLLSGESILGEEFSIRSVTGKDVEAEVYAVPLMNGAPHPEGALVMLQDITKRKEMERRFLQSQKMEAVGLLAGGVAHDIRNQLTVIKGYGEMLLRRSLVPGSAVQYVEELLTAAERSASIADQLLAFSRKQALLPVVTDPNSIVKEIASTVGCMIGEDIRLENSLERDIGLVKLDPGRFQQALMNLIVNARDAMPKGGRLVIETANVELDEEFVQEHVNAAPGPHVLVSVSDTGAGMDEETLERIFEPFYTTKPAGEGTGLGLPMVFGFVNQSQGCLDVTSQPQQGSRFDMYFPRVVGVHETVDTGRLSESLSMGDGTILVVEDDQNVRDILVEDLRESGYTVLEAASAEEALPIGICYEDHIDLLVTDVVMPGMSGLELLEGIRAVRPGIKVLYVSGYMPDTLKRHGLESSEVEILMKPFSTGEPSRTVARLLEYSKYDKQSGNRRSQKTDQIPGDGGAEMRESAT